ncbi:putative TetR-family transcriptional regulator [Actinoplanes missouriensis 431]|uniref:Putative TetR-family transcriptional regulator n=1 Tax=Actinoplanes missouriensis (strain ATCC 14538 / DSM 43046 / CBS 188.64 / JCM 3121 / NBRC 102363 / NCIMB 12654 / NRRL B-3342 / UNCC 431) TaxID=512565 RepID=I0GZJ2_ACTM4|nr:TetR family transcriptional regulator C-terminal domain-containing protein [Actinoplanes missouriensis]BAL86179.1 putative TetR-family transcriptional regulator [Actinoplanes missouriensis 431]
MPRLIDHSVREQAIADAAWRVLARDGILALSVRNVAEEAGLATASLRRSFPTQDALRAYCLELAGRRAQARLDALPIGTDMRRHVEQCLEQLLPLDPDRRMEMEVFLTLGALAFTNPVMRASFDTSHALVGQACASLLGMLAETPPYTGLRPRLAEHGRRLQVLIDGLGFHLAHNPELPPSWATHELRRYLDALREAA